MADKEIGGRLKSAREALKLTQQKVCELLNISKAQTLSAYERGENSPPIDALKALSKLYHVSIDWIVCGEQFQNTVELGKQELIANLFSAAYNLGLDIGWDKDWDGEPTGRYVIWLENDTLKGFNELMGDLIRLHDLRELLGSDDYETLVQKRIKTRALESNNFESITPKSQDFQEESEGDVCELPF